MEIQSSYHTFNRLSSKIQTYDDQYSNLEPTPQKKAVKIVDAKKSEYEKLKKSIECLFVYYCEYNEDKG